MLGTRVVGVEKSGMKRHGRYEFRPEEASL